MRSGALASATRSAANCFDSSNPIKDGYVALAAFASFPFQLLASFLLRLRLMLVPIPIIVLMLASLLLFVIVTVSVSILALVPVPVLVKDLALMLVVSLVLCSIHVARVS